MVKQKQLEKLSCEIDTRLEKIDLSNADEIMHLKKFNKNFKALGCGASRYVFIHKNNKVVLKIESQRSRRHFKQNEKEIANYKALPKRLRCYFAKPLAHAENYAWILMEKVETKDEEGVTYEKRYKIKQKLTDIFNKHNIVIRDLHGGNVGEKNGEPIVFDYGWNWLFPNLG